MQKTEETSLVWFRNDLRTIDNAVLAKACKNGRNIIGVYCFDPRHFEVNSFGFRKTEKFRAKFLIETIHVLKEQLDKLNIDLLVDHDLPEIVIPNICKNFNITDIFIQEEWTQEEVDTTCLVKIKNATGKMEFYL